jgi:hypothetical protein
METPKTSVGSSSKVNSPVSIKPTKGNSVVELDKITENLRLEESSGSTDTASGEKVDNISEKDFITNHSNVSGNFEDT